MNNNEKKIYLAKARIIKALAHSTRIWIVDRLSERERCVCEFVNEIDADFSTVSKHLSVLRNAGIIGQEKRGKQIFYSLKVPCIMNFMKCVQAVMLSNLEEQKEISA